MSTTVFLFLVNIVVLLGAVYALLVCSWIVEWLTCGPALGLVMVALGLFNWQELRTKPSAAIEIKISRRTQTVTQTNSGARDRGGCRVTAEDSRMMLPRLQAAH